MQKSLVSTPKDALACLVDCALATVERMALKTHIPKREFDRQISIAQNGIAWMEQFGCEVGEHDRAFDARNARGVAKWAERLRDCSGVHGRSIVS